MLLKQIIAATGRADDKESAMDRLMSLSFDARTAYRLAKLHPKLIEETNSYYKQVNKVYEKFGTKADGGWTFDEKGRNAANVEISELLETEAEGLTTVEIKLTDGMMIAPRDMLLLEGVVEFAGLEEGD